MKRRISGLIQVVTMVAVVCFARNVLADNDTDTNSWSSGVELGALTNCSAAAINAAVVCGDTRGVRVEGYNALTLEIKYTWAAGSGWEFYLESCNEGHAATDCTDATDWHRVATQGVTPGVITLTAGKVTHASGASDQIAWTVGINYRRVRLAAFVATGSPTSSDKITVNGRLGWLPAGI